MFFITCTCVVDVSQGCSKGSALAIDKDICPRYCCSPLSYKPKIDCALAHSERARMGPSCQERVQL